MKKRIMPRLLDPLVGRADGDKKGAPVVEHPHVGRATACPTCQGRGIKFYSRGKWRCLETCRECKGKRAANSESATSGSYNQQGKRS